MYLFTFFIINCCIVLKLDMYKTSLETFNAIIQIANVLIVIFIIFLMLNVKD